MTMKSGIKFVVLSFIEIINELCRDWDFKDFNQSSE